MKQWYCRLASPVQRSVVPSVEEEEEEDLLVQPPYGGAGLETHSACSHSPPPGRVANWSACSVSKLLHRIAGDVSRQALGHDRPIQSVLPPSNHASSP